MEISVRLKVTVDAASWTDAYGVRGVKDITADVRRYCATAVQAQLQHAVDGNAEVTVR